MNSTPQIDEESAATYVMSVFFKGFWTAKAVGYHRFIIGLNRCRCHGKGLSGVEWAAPVRIVCGLALPAAAP